MDKDGKKKTCYSINKNYIYNYLDTVTNIYKDYMIALSDYDSIKKF